MTTLREIDHQGEAFGAFLETRRWDVLEGRTIIGQIWRSLRQADNVVCWMVKPAAIEFSIPQSAIAAGYRATTKKGAIQEILNWHNNAHLNQKSSDWTLHCYRHWLAAAIYDSKEESRSFLAIHPDGRRRWISLSYIDELTENRGMMGTPGWHATGHRGNRTVIVHSAGTPEEAMDLLIAQISLPASPEDREKRMMTTPLPVERHYGTLAASLAP
jgi:hypothetical protein